MDSFEEHPKVLRILIVADVDSASVNSLAERFVPQTPQFDCIVCCGPFVHDFDWAASKENHAISQGDMASIIASLENIVCRVVYLPSEKDPPTSYTEQLHLTPNSVNINARRMTLREGLFISGFTESSEDLSVGKAFDPEDRDRADVSDDEFEDVEVKSGSSSIAIISKVLSEVKERATETSIFAAETASIVPSMSMESEESGIFILNYKYSHTLNHFLFHMPECLNSAGVSLCIIPPPSCRVGEALRLPSSFGNLSIVVPPSLKNEGRYCVATLILVDGKWAIDSILTS